MDHHHWTKCAVSSWLFNMHDIILRYIMYRLSSMTNLKLMVMPGIVKSNYSSKVFSNDIPFKMMIRGRGLIPLPLFEFKLTCVTTYLRYCIFKKYCPVSGHTTLSYRMLFMVLWWQLLWSILVWQKHQEVQRKINLVHYWNMQGKNARGNGYVSSLLP